MKISREDQRRVSLRYLHDGVTGKTTLTIDVESPDEDMPHEHRQDLKSMAEELLGVPIGSLPEDVSVNLRPAKGHSHPESKNTETAPEGVSVPRQAIKV